MGKYGGYLTINQVRNLECKEAKKILKDNKVPREDRKEIIGMISEAYFEFKQSTEFNKRFIEFICKKYDVSEEQLSKEFFEYEFPGSPCIKMLIGK